MTIDSPGNTNIRNKHLERIRPTLKQTNRVSSGNIGGIADQRQPDNANNGSRREIGAINNGASIPAGVLKELQELQQSVSENNKLIDKVAVSRQLLQENTSKYSILMDEYVEWRLKEEKLLRTLQDKEDEIRDLKEKIGMQSI